VSPVGYRRDHDAAGCQVGRQGGQEGPRVDQVFQDVGENDDVKAPVELPIGEDRRGVADVHPVKPVRRLRRH
jgi:hypothetical protein